MSGHPSLSITGGHPSPSVAAVVIHHPLGEIGGRYTWGGRASLAQDGPGPEAQTADLLRVMEGRETPVTRLGLASYIHEAPQGVLHITPAYS